MPVAPPQSGTAPAERENELGIELSAVICAVTGDDPKVLAIRHREGSDGEAGEARESLPSGPLERGHRTLEIGLRNWVERQTLQHLGHVEQLYTFGDRARGEDGRRSLSLAYLALVREARPAGDAEARWESWYRYFPWEDWRDGRPAVLGPLLDGLRDWAGRDGLRTDRVTLCFGAPAASDRREGSGWQEAGWNDERVLERYELLYEAGLVAEARRERGLAPDAPFASGAPMIADHRRMLALAITRLRGKIKYRPVVFELMPPSFTLLQLQRAVEALAGVRLHKGNFRRLIEQQRLVEESGETSLETGGRPARLVRFRHEVLLERPAPGVRLPGGGGGRR